MKVNIWSGFHSNEIYDLILKTWVSENELLILCAPGINPENLLKYLPEAYPHRPVFGVFTSGTSGQEPKLVLYTRNNILSSLNAILKFFDESKINSIFCYPQPFHTFGLLLGYVLAIEKRWRFITSEGRYNREFHKKWVEAINEGLLTIGTPTHFKDLIHFVIENKIDPKQSCSCIVGGAKVTVSLWEDFQNILKIQAPSIGYGATEASPGISHLPAGHKPSENGEIGFKLDSIEILNQTESGFDIQGPSVCLATVTSKGIVFPEKIRIADEIELRSDGVWIFKGRSDLVMNRGGIKFSLVAIENFILEKFKVDSVALPVPHPRLGQELALLLEGSEDLESIHQELSKNFHASFDKKYFRNISKLPLNGNFKIERKKAQEIAKDLFFDFRTYEI